jgi:hypothetical protein
MERGCCALVVRAALSGVSTPPSMIALDPFGEIYPEVEHMFMEE